MKEKAERNKQLVADKESGMSQHQLALKYGITDQYAWTLYSKYKNKYGKRKS